MSQVVAIVIVNDTLTEENLMDNPGITHNARLSRMGVGVHAYVETGVIRLDLDDGTTRWDLDDSDAERLVAILRAAIADREA